jgi:antitoxin MazE
LKARIEKWGNSLALRIPKPFAEESNLHEYTAVDVSVRAGKLVVVVIEKPYLTLGDLVAKITPSNRHAEVETGKAVGNEVW